MKRCIITLSAAILLLSASPARAEPGIRLGLTSDPDTLFVGFFYEAPITNLGRNSWLTIEPGIDLGFGEDADIMTLRGTFNFKFVFLVDRRVQLYPLIGASVYYWNVDDGPDGTEGGLNLGGGMQFDQFSFELWGGFNDDGPFPELTFLFGIAF